MVVLKDHIETVNSYRYLVMLFTTSLSWETLSKEKSKLAKLAVNSVWNNLIENKTSKVTCFNSVMRTINCCGSQVWGCFESDYVGFVQKLFLTKLFRLPYNTPNYVLYLEKGFDRLFFYNLRIN